MRRPSYNDADSFSPIGRGVIRGFAWTFCPLLVLLIVSAVVR